MLRAAADGEGTLPPPRWPVHHPGLRTPLSKLCVACCDDFVTRDGSPLAGKDLFAD